MLNASGYVTARRRATVSSKVTGKVLEVFVEEGMAVKKGQVLARLDDSQMRAALAVAGRSSTAARSAAAEDEARLREAERQSTRLDAARAGEGRRPRRGRYGRRPRSSRSRRASRWREQQVEVARAPGRGAARPISRDMVVRAPFDGVAISKDAQPGEMISPVSAGGGFTRTGICTIVDMTSLEIEVDVNESYINRVKPGQPVEAVLDAYPDWRIPAHVITTVPTADRQKATVQGAHRGSRKLDPRILPDMGVKVSFLDERQADSRRRAAEAAAARAEERRCDRRRRSSVVFVVREDRVERRAVKVGVARRRSGRSASRD